MLKNINGLYTCSELKNSMSPICFDYILQYYVKCIILKYVDKLKGCENNGENVSS